MVSPSIPTGHTTPKRGSPVNHYKFGDYSRRLRVRRVLERKYTDPQCGPQEGFSCW
jgi:hypothetical protein